MTRTSKKRHMIEVTPDMYKAAESVGKSIGISARRVLLHVMDSALGADVKQYDSRMRTLLMQRINAKLEPDE